MQESADYQDELDALKKESEIPMEDLLESLPKGMLDRITGHGKLDSDESGADVDAQEGDDDEDDDEDDDDNDSDDKDSDDKDSDDNDSVSM